MGVVKVGENVKNMEMRFQESADIMEVVNTTKFFMEHQSACLFTLEGAKKEDDRGEMYIPVQSSLETIKDIKGQPFIFKDKKFGSVNIKSIEFSPHKGYFNEKKFKETRGLIDLKVKFKGRGQKAKYDRTRTISLWVYAKKELVEEAKILYCDSSKTDFIEEIRVSVMSQVCHSFNSRYDYKNKKCEFVSKNDRRRARDRILKGNNFEIDPQKLIEIYERVLKGK